VLWWRQQQLLLKLLQLSLQLLLLLPLLRWLHSKGAPRHEVGQWP
jgi:hypothetical protein